MTSVNEYARITAVIAAMSEEIRYRHAARIEAQSQFDAISVQIAHDQDRGNCSPDALDRLAVFDAALKTIDGSLLEAILGIRARFEVEIGDD